jgi:RNA polymerase sigma-70 factor, ECF subfamily
MQTDARLLKKETVKLDKSDLIQIYEQYHQPLYRYSMRMLGDPDLAEECVSETFSRFLQALKNGGGPRENIQAYLYRVAHNWITDYYRSRPTTESLELPISADKNESPLAVITRNQEQERVHQALLRLSPEQRQVILLRFFEDWPHESIAAAVGKTAEATRALQYRALASLRKMLVEQEE